MGVPLRGARGSRFCWPLRQQNWGHRASLRRCPQPVSWEVCRGPYRAGKPGSRHRAERPAGGIMANRARQGRQNLGATMRPAPQPEQPRSGLAFHLAALMQKMQHTDFASLMAGKGCSRTGRRQPGVPKRVSIATPAWLAARGTTRPAARFNIGPGWLTTKHYARFKWRLVTRMLGPDA